jgi:hypothetical protein
MRSRVVPTFSRVGGDPDAAECSCNVLISGRLDAKPIEESVDLAANDEEIDAILAEFDGDPRAAIRALLHDLATLASEAAVSRGFVRRRLLPFRLDDVPMETK